MAPSRRRISRAEWISSLWNVKGAVLRAPVDPVIAVDRVEHVVGKAGEFPLVVQDVAKIGCPVITDISAQLHYRELLGGDAPEKVILVELTGQHELA